MYRNSYLATSAWSNYFRSNCKLHKPKEQLKAGDLLCGFVRMHDNPKCKDAILVAFYEALEDTKTSKYIFHPVVFDLAETISAVLVSTIGGMQDTTHMDNLFQLYSNVFTTDQQLLDRAYNGIIHAMKEYLEEGDIKRCCLLSLSLRNKDGSQHILAKSALRIMMYEYMSDSDRKEAESWLDTHSEI